MKRPDADCDRGVSLASCCPGLGRPSPACKQENLEFVSGFVAGVTDKAAHDAGFVAVLMADKADLEKKTGPENREEGRKAIRTVQPFCIHAGAGAKLGDMTDLVCRALEMFPDTRKQGHRDHSRCSESEISLQERTPAGGTSAGEMTRSVPELSPSSPSGLRRALFVFVFCVAAHAKPKAKRGAGRGD